MEIIKEAFFDMKQWFMNNEVPFYDKFGAGFLISCALIMLCFVVFAYFSLMIKSFFLWVVMNLAVIAMYIVIYLTNKYDI